MKHHATDKPILSSILWVLIALLSVGQTVLATSGADTVRRQQYRKLRSNQIKRMKENDRKRTLLESVNIQKDVVYGTEHPTRQSLDLYVPKNATKPLPLVVWIHGGAWMGGSKENCRALGLVAHGYAVASINYRLTNVATFPAQIYDCKAAIRYLRAHAAENNIDPDRIGVWGASAGGHLAALLGVSNGKKELEGAVGKYLETSSDVQAVCDWFGPSDFFTMPEETRKSKIDKDPIRLLLGGPVSEEKETARLASPVTYVDKDATPFLIMHGQRDKVVPVRQSQLLHDTLKKAGVDSTLILFKGKGHGFGGQAEVLDPVMEFFKRILKVKSDKPPKDLAHEKEKK